jgi:hypothetical protein
MAILFSGDFHANAQRELSIITKNALLATYGEEVFREIRYHIILGDGGFLWPGNERGDAYNYKTLAKRPFPVLCVIGNHEPVLGRRDLEEADIGIGEKVILVNREPFVAYLKRGAFYDIEGSRFLVLGGALSIDKAYRKPNKSWWEDEYWRPEEEAALWELLAGSPEADYVLSHTGPNRVNEKLFLLDASVYHMKFADEVALLNDRVDARIRTQAWFCGHWHQDAVFTDETLNRSYRYLYHSTIVLKDGVLRIGR